MKKAKLLIPAIAVLAMSTAAAVTGTVAWFTASRTAKLADQTTTIINTVAGLKATLGASTGTTIQDQLVKHAEGTSFSDGSVDVASEVGYKSVIGTGGTVTGFDVAEGLKNGEQFVATKYTITFSLSNADDPGTYGIFLDVNGSTPATKATVDKETESQGKLKSALRVGFKTTEKALYYQPSKETATEAHANIKYVNGTTLETNEVPCTDANFIGNDATVPAKGTAGNNYLGNVTSAQTLTVTVYTWFEGIGWDIKTTVKNAFTFGLSFEMRPSA